MSDCGKLVLGVKTTIERVWEFGAFGFFFLIFTYSSHASRALRRACGQGAVLSLCMVRPGSGRFGVGFWVGFWVGLRARDFPTERVLSRTPLIIRTVPLFAC